jgi:hypothetical protein
MTTTKDTATLSVCGDVLSVTWTGSVWQAPCCGAQFALVKDAMRCEVEAYYSACGEDLDEKAEEIDDLLSNIETDAAYSADARNDLYRMVNGAVSDSFGAAREMIESGDIDELIADAGHEGDTAADIIEAATGFRS